MSSTRLNTWFNKFSYSPWRADELITALGHSVQKASSEARNNSENREPNVRVDDVRKALELEGLRVKFERIANLHTIRRTYLRNLFALTVTWLVLVVVFVLMDGFEYHGFDLSDSVIIAFITSTTLNVQGLFHFALKWLYSR